MTPDRARLAFGAALLLVGVGSGIWFTERLREYPGPPLPVALGDFDNQSGDPALDGALELVLDEGRFVVRERAQIAISGRIASAGPGYRIELRVLELPSGEALVEAEEIVGSKAEVAKAFEALSAELRRELAKAGR